MLNTYLRLTALVIIQRQFIVTRLEPAEEKAAASQSWTESIYSRLIALLVEALPNSGYIRLMKHIVVRTRSFLGSSVKSATNIRLRHVVTCENIRNYAHHYFCGFMSTDPSPPTWLADCVQSIISANFLSASVSSYSLCDDAQILVWFLVFWLPATSTPVLLTIWQSLEVVQFFMKYYRTWLSNTAPHR
jgi:hypothetical protein